MATTTTKRAPRARKPNLRTALANAREAPRATQHDLGIAPDERVGPAGQMSLWWAPMPELPEDHVSAHVRNEALAERAERVVKCLDVLDAINAIRPFRRAPRVNHARARERWESTGAACIAAPEGPELTYRNRHLHQHVVRVYYRSMGDEILYFECRNLTEGERAALVSEYRRSEYDSLLVQSWDDATRIATDTEPPAVLHGARLVILPSQVTPAPEAPIGAGEPPAPVEVAPVEVVEGAPVIAAGAPPAPDEVTRSATPTITVRQIEDGGPGTLRPRTTIDAGEPGPQQPDPRPGYYYVSAIDGARRTIVRGPWINDHAGALAAVDRVRREAERFDHRAAFYAFGTCRSNTDLGPGVLGGALVPPE